MRYKFFTLFLALIASVGIIFAQTGTCGENITWDLTDGVLTISGTGEMYDYYYGNEAPWYSFNSSISSITIGDGITNIGQRMFKSCINVDSVTIPSSVKNIGDYAFNGCKKITSIALPNGITSIGFGAFGYCEKLTSIVIPDSVTVIKGFAFENCKALTTLSIGKSVQHIETFAFDYADHISSVTWNAINCADFYNIESFFIISDYNISLTIGEDVERIPAYLCYHMKYLRSVTIPAKVNSIGEYAFGNCQYLTEVNVESIVPPSVTNNSFNNNCLILVPLGTLANYRTAWNQYRVHVLPLSASINSVGATNANIEINDLSQTNSIVAYGIEGGEDFTSNVFECTGLESNTNYTNTPLFVRTTAGDYDTIHISFTTSALELTTQPSKPVSSTTAILLAETNMSDAEVSCGFEYKRNDAPADMEGNKVYCPVASGQMAGRLKGLKDDVYYKYRAFYQSAAGNMYYGDWQYIFTGDVSVEFDPILYTYAATVVRENEATITGYALAGSEDFTEQGFEYWADSRVPQAENAPARMPAALGEHFFVQADGIRMTVTLTNLDAGTNYKYRAYGKVGNQYYYGSEQSFTTEGEYVPSEKEAIENTSVATPLATKILRNGQVLILRGEKVYTVTGQKVK